MQSSGMAQNITTHSSDIDWLSITWITRFEYQMFNWLLINGWVNAWDYNKSEIKAQKQTNNILY